MTTRPNTCQADRDLLENLGLPDDPDQTEDTALPSHDELMPS
ncbi:hypothetical protein [Mycobacterium sp. 29Ha]|nr:hypothetical protein [Mycobacterium sp. 29Ha]